MSDNLKERIEKSIESNDRVLRRSGRKYGNQNSWEGDFRRKFKKCLVYGSILSALALGAYGSHHYWNKYQNYIDMQNKKVYYYQKKFNNVKHYYNKRSYLHADRLSEELQEEMSNESFLSPTDDLYDKVKEYDNKYIDPEVRRINYERFKQKLKSLPYKLKDDWDETKYKIGYWWDDLTPKEKGAVGFGSMVLFALICRILFGRKKKGTKEE